VSAGFRKRGISSAFPPGKSRLPFIRIRAIRGDDTYIVVNVVDSEKDVKPGAEDQIARKVLVIGVFLDDYIRIHRGQNVVSTYEPSREPHIHMISPVHLAASNASLDEGEWIVRMPIFHLSHSTHHPANPYFP
jgi:hypothetical protein